MSHPNETALRDAYACFAKGDLEGFLGRCTDDVTFTVPGANRVAGTYTKGTFMDLVGKVMETTQGSFGEEIVDAVANDDKAILLVHQWFDRDIGHQDFRVAHIITLQGGRIATWQEWTGNQAEFDAAWA